MASLAIFCPVDLMRVFTMPVGKPLSCEKNFWHCAAFQKKSFGQWKTHIETSKFAKRFFQAKFFEK